ncbi:MAG: hypothetical protein WHS46_07665 [Desulfosoma sp.]
MGKSLGIRCALGFLCIILGLEGGAPWAAQDLSQTFVAQGTSPLQPANRAQSRTQALEDLLRQAVLQAVGTLVPGQELAQKNKEIRNGIVSQAERYAQSFKILAEYTDGDLYRVQGAVDVALGTLRADLEKMGIALQSAPSLGEGLQTTGSEAAAREEAGSASAPVVPEVQPPFSKDHEAPKGRLLWAVTENWDPPSTSTLQEGSVTQGELGVWFADEARDYGWQVTFPKESPQGVPSTAEQLVPWLEEARRRGVSHLIMGTAGKAGDALEVRLEVVDAGSGQSVARLDERVSGFSHESSEGMILLAEVLASKLEPVLSKGTFAAQEPSQVQAAPSPSPAPVAGPGSWEVVLKGDASYAAWLSMEKRLKETNKDFAVDSVILETEGVAARAKNVDPEALKGLDGMPVGIQMVLRMEGIDPAARRITFSVVPVAEESQASPAQKSETP